ncbi:AraC family transcriptional regulator [Microvirga terrae]|uniref:AraC family transcriptional regulator n=2 Tax=Methylobacteriaceae TaxID=119045 RepID=A0ABY5S0L4_9HYPH|nr:AraC family transcriptional regulator [Microvirga terrae]MBQ0821754.1 AraC family transcriptional regulator [Microvirga sp. HBU67558]UVF22002.1 AraC family transcriptional regulator [Microvirga terrae]
MPVSRDASSGGRTLPPGYIHLGVAREIEPMLREFGLDPDPIIREAGLDPRLFEDGANVIPHAALGRLLSLSVSRTNCPHFGLLVGQRATILSLGLVGRLMQQSDTVGDAMRGLVSNLSIQNRGAVPSLTIVGDTALFTFSVYQPEAQSAGQISDGSLAVSVNALRALCGSEWNPSEVLLPRAAPADQEPYRRHFRAPVRFNQESATIVFPARDLEIRIAGADPVLRAMLEQRIQQMKGAPDSAFSDDIRRLLRTRLTSNHCSADDIAHLLAMHRRTLSRRLKDSGMGYRAITNEIRFEIARQLLTDTQVPLSQIAAALGYSEASAFTRAFRRWSGQTPTAWRGDGH